MQIEEAYMRDFEKQKYLANSRNNTHSPYDDLYKMQLGTKRRISKGSLKPRSQINVSKAAAVECPTGSSNASNTTIK